jgi:hypothetical protein
LQHLSDSRWIATEETIEPLLADALYALRPLLDSFNNAFRAIEQRP